MENYFETRKDELNQEAQLRKDRFINDTLRLNQEFQQDWTNLNNKLIEVTKKEEEQDKVNPK
jgi:hypothetical protein